jgi:hypothetical protein
VIDTFTGRYEPGDTVVMGWENLFYVYTVVSVHRTGLRLKHEDYPEETEARVEVIGTLSDGTEVFGIRNLWPVASE